MSLRDRLENIKHDVTQSPVATPQAIAAENRSYQELKSRIHQKLLDRVDLALMESLPRELLQEELKVLVERLLSEETLAINEAERKSLVRDIQHEVLGLGPIETLLADSTLSDILVNTHRQVYVERAGKLELTDVRFESDAHLMKIIDKIVSGIGRRVDESSPMVDARLPDGSRVNAIIPPLAIDGPILSIRRFAVTPLAMDDIIRGKSLTPEMAQIIGGLIKAKVNVLISGGTGTGKTTLLNILSGFIPHSERIITIEDAAELQLQQPHVVRLETRPPNIEGKGEVPQRLLVINSLRMRPDRIILGEVRGAEAFDMLQAMNTGHEGSLTTVHANTPRDALTRLENMIGMTGLNLPPKAMRQQISSALTAVIHVSRLTDGKRKVTSIEEITGMEGEIITMQQIFAFEQTGVAEDGTVLGHFRATGIRPKFTDRLITRGIKISDEIFDPTKLYE
ncbi:type II/IV secretion system-related protein [Ferrigenium kumadai]|uniref:Type II/IV secretion system-related protein n=1 Tax=Ferrigenium kumadai TaxID=1682490 RepID=A0AAN1SZQ1_9PROT|nr:CpaF family protein [Ferrigenium kumadai]BBI99772.1 type II/IV secretion system-related protein [Ferrigenium kumadai]